jgi:hypothetical protein
MQRLPENLPKTLAKQKSRSEEPEKGVCLPAFIYA